MIFIYYRELLTISMNSEDTCLKIDLEKSILKLKKKKSIP